MLSTSLIVITHADVDLALSAEAALIAMLALPVQKAAALEAAPPHTSEQQHSPAAWLYSDQVVHSIDCDRRAQGQTSQ